MLTDLPAGNREGINANKAETNQWDPKPLVPTLSFEHTICCSLTRMIDNIWKDGRIPLNDWEEENRVIVDDLLFLVMFWGFILYTHHKLLKI